MTNPELDRIRRAWQNATPGDVVRALNQIADYASPVAAIIREEAEQRGLTSASDEAFPVPAYAPIRKLGRTAATGLASAWRPLRRQIERHPFISAAVLGVVYYLAASNLPHPWGLGYLWLGFYFVGLAAICLPLRRYRLTILVPVIAGSFSWATWFVIALRSWISEWAPALTWSGIAAGLSVVFGVCAVLPALLLTGVAYVRNRYWPVHEASRCRVCDYDLRGLPEPRCPECGTPFDPAEIPTLGRPEDGGE